MKYFFAAVALLALIAAIAMSMRTESQSTLLGKAPKVEKPTHSERATPLKAKTTQNREAIDPSNSEDEQNATDSTTPPKPSEEVAKADISHFTRELQDIYRTAMRGPNLPPPTASILHAMGAEESAQNAKIVDEALAPWRTDLDEAWRESKSQQTDLVLAKLEGGEFIEIDESNFDSSPYQNFTYTPLVHYGKDDSTRLVVIQPGESSTFDAAAENYGAILAAALGSLEQASFQLTPSQH